MGITYVALLLIHMANLEPYVGMGKWVGRITEDTVETLQTFVILALLFVYYPETEKNLVGFVEV